MTEQAELPRHQPIAIGKLGPVEFQRCKCGFTLAEYKGELYWLQAKPIKGPVTLEDLAKAARHSFCPTAAFEIRKQKRKNKESMLTNS